MKISILFCFLIAINANSILAQEMKLPEKPFSENHFGKEVVDNYRYSETTKDTLVQKWFKNNGDEARNVLNSISGRKSLMENFLDFEKRKSAIVSNLRITEDDFNFYLKKTENDKTGKLYYKKNKDGLEVLLFDPNDYKNETKNNYIINYLKPSWDSNFIAVGLSKNGEETGEIIFIDVKQKKISFESISNCWPAEFGIDWLPDNSGIIYLHIPVIDNKDSNYILNTELVLYKLGDSPKKHKVLLSKLNNPDIKIESADFPIVDVLTKNNKYILVSLAGVSSYFDYYYASVQELQNERIEWKALIKKEDNLLNPSLNDTCFYAMSANKASNYKIIKANISSFNSINEEIIVPENKKETITDFKIVKDGMFYTTSKNGVEAKLYFIDKKNIVKHIDLPINSGTITISSKNRNSNDLWVSLSGWTSPLRRYFYNIQTNQFQEENLVPIPEYPEFKDFVVKEIEIPSYDGTLIPVSIIYKKKLNKNKKNNVLLYGYGAYGVSTLPRFSPVFLSWVANDGVYVISHVRGGGEKGDDWYKGGFKENKPNTWKDLIATAEYLINEKITSNKKIAVIGGSAGGVLVGRAITERPDLFKVMLCHNGMLNMLRINEAPNGPNNMKEFGNPEIREEFNMLYNMDSYQQITPGIKYPSCLISVGMNDARVATWMSGKFVAKMRASTTSKNPVLFAVDYNSGHGIGSTNLQLYNNYADEFSFALWQMGHPKFKLMKK
ncbi:prolyl oligopeptidase family serine peptidase [Flavobacterium amniphilum]|uniref:prolyl oligopeptidase family serine peptidase n=1 Tax=Flavobacterium amniphilum TaxID=1834035 RepID=UPI00202A61DE|nr:prolyl oligopeptidase family serine peptidase [Flavobacterium amniphilum]MCL9805872.1 prolyl oligopeptidase family serine peptidase [Flavobacterium amniphilum]